MAEETNTDDTPEETPATEPAGVSAESGTDGDGLDTPAPNGDPADAEAAERAGDGDTAQGDDAPEADADADADAEAEADAEPAAAPKQPGPPPKPARSAEERQADRDAARTRKAAARSRRRAKEKQARAARDNAEGTPPRKHGEGRAKVRQGIVTSDKADKTITVRIDTARRHRRYEKIVRSSSTLHAHDEANDAGTGDVVRVVESRPLSRTKRWRLLDVVERAR